MAKKRARRFWSDDEKRLICRQSRVDGVSVSQVARRYDVNANLVLSWLRDERFAVADDDPAATGTMIEGEARFLPVEIVEHERSKGAARQVPCRERGEDGEATGVLEVELACGHRLRIVGTYDPAALSKLIRSLSA